jgi:uncharacterized protein involved in type VI secretion and phage assembly
MLMHETSLMESWLEARVPHGLGGNWYGVHVALVTDIKDPNNQGRVKVSLPWSGDTAGARYECWARLVTLMAGNQRGSWFVPDVNDEVLIAFEAGSPQRPYVMGALWNGRDAPPASMDSGGQNDKKILRSRNGVQITLDDQQGQEQFIVETPGGQRITLKDGPGSIEVMDSNSNSIKLESSGVTVNASSKVTISASIVELSAGTVTVNAGMSRFNGVIQADTVITNSVISSSYTPGAGNIW